MPRKLRYILYLVVYFFKNNNKGTLTVTRYESVFFSLTFPANPNPKKKNKDKGKKAKDKKSTKVTMPQSCCEKDILSKHTECSTSRCKYNTEKNV